MSAISLGNTRLEEIANFIGRPARSVYPYVENLIRLGFIEKEFPILGKKKRSIYKIRDNLLFSWFRLVYPNQAKIPLGEVEINKDSLIQILSKKFEEIARNFLILKRPVNFKEIGSWWFRGEEIDIVVLGDNTIFLFDVK